MLRSVLRISRCVARRPINSLATVTRQYSYVKSLFNTNTHNSAQNRKFTTTSDKVELSDNIEPAVFEEICNETLESLCDYFEELVDAAPNLKGADVTYSDGVLTVSLGSNYGTYVINRQTPNKQIWLSSPLSGPKRYDLVLKNGGYWVYKHDGVSLHRLLQNELSKISENKVEFQKCAHSLM